MQKVKLFLLIPPILLLALAGAILYLLVADPAEPGGDMMPVPTAPAPYPPPKAPGNILMDVGTVEAQRVNATTPFIANGIQIPAAFIFTGNATDRTRALACLAAAAYYEAGDDPVGQAAVVQVVLNRMRHPAFPKTVCGVVLQGSERRTGCQFTFTCDGALQRPIPPKAWMRARDVGNVALSGNIFPAVGLATHYHTDWVVPYWSKSLEKIAEVGTHLFFRWPGYYGKQAAYSGRYASGEVVTGRIQALVEADQIDRAAGDVAAIDPSMESYMPKTVQLAGVTAVDLQGSAVRYANSATGDYIVRLEAGAFPGSFAVLAHQMCKANDMCSVWGWTRPADMPMTFPIPAPAQRSASFLYEKTVARPTGVARWNCREFGDRPVSQCLPGTAPASS